MMEILLEVEDIKKEPTDLISSDEWKIPAEMQMDIVKKESDNLIHTELDIKSEEKELSVFSSTSYEMCPSYNIKIETDEQIVKVECQDVLDEGMEDPLDVSCEIKVEGKEDHDIFYSKDELKTNAEESEEEKKCNSRTDNSSEFSGKVELNDKNQEKKYACPICNKMFRFKRNLHNHKRIHSDLKPYECHICKKSFKQISTLHRHLTTHSNEKPYACDVCMKFFRLKCHLDKHKLIHTNIKLYSCSECDKSFTHKHHLLRHLPMHTDDKSYSCDFCNKKFRHKLSLTLHRRRHTGEKPYTCNICNKSFIQNAGLRYHARTCKP